MKQGDKRLLIKFISIVVIMVSVFLLFGGFAVYAYKKSIPLKPKQIIPADGVSDEKENTKEEKKETNKEESGGLFQPPVKTNFLVTGIDQTGSLTDVILVGSFDRNTKKFNIISIPRDTYVQSDKETIAELKKLGRFLPSVSKINEIHSYAGKEIGIKYTKSKIEEMLNIKIDYYAKIDLVAFRKIVDGVGGIYMDIPHPGLYYNDPLQDLVIAVPPGKQVLLKGELAEGVVRYRSTYVNGDEGRIDIQHEFMKQFFSQVLNKEAIINNAGSLLTTFISYVSTDFGIENLPKYIQYIGDIKGTNFNFYTLPGEPRYIDGVSYFICDPVKTSELVDKIFYKSGIEENIEDGEVSSKNLSIKILNGSGVSGLANVKRDILESKDFKVLNTDVYEGSKKSETRIMVRSNKYGNDLLEYFKNPVIEVDESMPKEYEIIVIVGTSEAQS